MDEKPVEDPPNLRHKCKLGSVAASTTMATAPINDEEGVVRCERAYTLKTIFSV